MGRAALLAVLLPVLLGPFAGPAAARTVFAHKEDESSSPSRGPLLAPVTVEVFCTHPLAPCGPIHEALLRLADRHPRGLRLVYRQIVASPQAGAPVAEALLEAWAQGRFFELDGLLDGRHATLSRAALVEAALLAGMDARTLAAALVDGRHRAQLEADQVWALRLGVERSPALVWNGASEPVPTTPDGYQALFEEAYERAHRLEGDGVLPRKLYMRLVGDAARTRARARRPSAGGDAATPVTIREEGAPVRGDDGAEVTFVLFSDFQCPACMLFERVLARAAEAYPGRTRLVWKHFPRAFLPDAQLAAEAAACAHAQGKFWAFHDQMLLAPGRVRRTDLLHHAEAAGLDVDEFMAALAQGRCEERVAADVAEAKVLRVTDAPTLFVNGLRITRLPSAAELHEIIWEELRPGLFGATEDSSR